MMTLKIGIVGNRESGKSSFIARLVGDEHVYQYGATTTKVCNGRNLANYGSMGTFYVRFKEYQLNDDINFNDIDALFVIVDGSTNDDNEFNLCVNLCNLWFEQTKKPTCIVVTKTDLTASNRRRRHNGKVNIFYVSNKYNFSAAAFNFLCKATRHQIMLEAPIYENETDEAYII